MLKPRKPANRGRNPPGVNGRPKADPSLVARAVELVRDEGLTCEEAGEQVGVELGTRLGGNTVRRAVKAKEGAGRALEVVEPVEAAPPHEYSPVVMAPCTRSGSGPPAGIWVK